MAEPFTPEQLAVFAAEQMEWKHARLRLHTVSHGQFAIIEFPWGEFHAVAADGREIADHEPVESL